MSGLSRTAETERRYDQIAAQIVNRYRRCTGIGWDDDVDRFLDWLATTLRPRLAKRTWWMYRAALKRMFERAQLPDAVARLCGLSAACCPARSQNSSAMKCKRLPPDDLAAICEALQSKRSRTAQITAIWLMASAFTGLRPCEWWQSRLDGRVLVVENAKATNGRGRGAERMLRIEDDDVAAIVAAMLDVASTFEYEAIYHTCRKHLARTVRKLWPNRRRYPTLYSGRHQFAADAKSVGSLRDVAALLGHASERTASRHYGRRRYGSGRLAVACAETEMRPAENRTAAEFPSHETFKE